MGWVSRREWAWAVAVAALAVALSSIPYGVGYLSQSPDRVFAGAVYDWEDYYSHLAKMQQGAQGAWQYRILFTPEDHPGATVNLFYLALGHLSGTLGLSPMVAYHLARLVCAAVVLLTAYWFAAFFVADRPARRVAYLLICFSSGLGWLLLLVTRSFALGGITPVDFWLVEMYTFFTILTFPHACLSLTAYLLAFVWMVQVLRGERSWWRWLAASVAGLVVAVIHPYVLLPLDATLVLYWAYRWICRRDAGERSLPWLLGFAVVPLPVIAYSYWALASHPVFRAWQDQSMTLSPPPLHYVAGYGLLLALAIWGGARVLREQDSPAVALVLWPLAVMPLLYAPLVFHLQRRVIEGVHVALSTLAAVGLCRGLLPAIQQSRLARWAASRGYAPHRLRWLLGRFIVALTTLSTWYLLASLSLAASSGYGLLYHSRSEVEAVLWLGDHTQPGDTVLSSYEIGGYIPARIGHRVFWGHWAETIHLPQKHVEVQAFYSASQAFDRPGFLARYGIAYVLHGPRERDVGQFEPGRAPYLEPVFQRGEVTVYRVALEQEGPG